MGKQKFFQEPSTVAGLAWGLHAPFREYIRRMSDGAMSALGDAEMRSSDETYFPLDPQSIPGQALRFTGTLQFTGHHGMLAVTIQDPWIEFREGAGVLTIVDPFDGGARMDVVAIDFQDDNTASTRLTEAGTDLFMGNYPEEIALDDLRILWAGKD
ncbi:HtaA domain-containing protein [Yaniella halotolerans]|uniref:HtaA domain-containing protein n=1 Tax=Yaniella halotolerans TaxID=225453 RepID=UPI0012EC3C11|nr:HtaA domain-containing protein [Yaniella halotolerans]